MHILLINPNTTTSITDLLLAEARKCAAPTTTLSAVTGRFGARYIASRAAYAIAGHAALEAYAEHGADADAVVLACFGDPALMALRDIATRPVIGMAEASCRTAAGMGGRFSIVTGGERWRPMLEEFVALIGLSHCLASIETVAPSGADIAREPDRALDLLVDACNVAVTRSHADTVILAGAGLAGLATRIAARVPVPLIDSLAASIRMAEQVAVRPSAPPTRAASDRRPLVESIGLTEALARRLD